MTNPLQRMQIRDCLINHTFGMVRNGGARAHQGWDLAAPVGTPVFAIRPGRIVDVRDEGDYGVQVTLEFEHGPRLLYAFYAHLLSVRCAEGEPVGEGATLGYTGMTGNARHLSARESHLHFEVRTAPRPGRGLVGRVDPGEVLGFQAYSSPRERMLW